LLLSGALITPAALTAFQQTEQKTTTTTTTTETQRYYDPEYKQYHVWDADEDRAYHSYIEETHRTYQEFPKVKVEEQREYWKWRHGHPGKVVVKTETEEKR
jgi:hypothetical protein